MPLRLLILLMGVVLLGAGGFLVYSSVSSPRAPSTDPILDKPPSPEESLALTEEQGAYLWDIEHHGNLLTKTEHGFTALTRALIRADAAGMEKCLTADFTGSEPSAETTPERLRTEILDIERRSAAEKSTPLPRRAFLDRLLQWRQIFSAPPKAKIALMALSPVSPGKVEGPWQGTGQLRIWGDWAKGKPAEVIAYLRYRIRPPTDENLQAGAWMASCDITQVQIGKAEHFLLQEVAAQRGIDPKQFYDNWKQDTFITNTGGVYACDFNRDGWIDLLITDINGVYLYQGLPGGKFRNVTDEVGLGKVPKGPTGFAYRAAFVDLDNDGWEDLIIGDLIFRNEQGQRFVSMAGKCNLYIPKDYSAIVAADFDRDGLIDLYITRPGPPLAGSWLTGQSGDHEGNYLYRNKGNWHFEDVTRLAGVGGDQRSTFTAAWLDANNDGWPDLYLINEFGDGVLYENLGRKGDEPVRFRPRQVAKPPCDFGAMGLAVGDIDNDGRIDIYSANMYSKAGSRVMANVPPGVYPEEVMARMRTFVTGSQLHRNLGDFKFEQLGKKWQINDCGWAYGPALVDLDNDGFLDLYATCGFITRTSADDEPDG
jgi:hypothetical protein